MDASPTLTGSIRAYDPDSGMKAPTGPAVDEGLAALGKRVDILDEVVGQLFDRVNPVLSEQDSEDTVGPLPPFGSSRVALRIGEEASRVAYLTDRLQSLTRRLEV